MHTSINDAECSEYPKSMTGGAARFFNLGTPKAETELPEAQTVATSSAMLFTINDEDHILRSLTDACAMENEVDGRRKALVARIATLVLYHLRHRGTEDLQLRITLLEPSS